MALSKTSTPSTLRSGKSDTTDFRVPDPAEAMRKTIAATRGAMAVPKAKVDAMMAREKAARDKKRK